MKDVSAVLFKLGRLLSLLVALCIISIASNASAAALDGLQFVDGYFEWTSRVDAAREYLGDNNGIYSRQWADDYYKKDTFTYEQHGYSKTTCYSDPTFANS